MKFLIVVDIQNDFVDGTLGSAEAVAIIENAAAKIRDFDGHIFVTYDTHGDDYMQTNEGKHLPVAHCIKGTHGWMLNPEIENALSGKTVTKTEKPTFGSMELVSLIKHVSGGEKPELELIGLCTDICVVSNALLLKANFPDADISVDASCCAGVTPMLHSAALDTMASCQIKIINR